jgi:hypothetical protein
MIAQGAQAGGRAERNGEAGRPCVEELARRKKLPADFLREVGFFDLRGGGIGVRYRDEDGEELFVRKRDVPGDPRRFIQEAGQKLRPFGLWRREKDVDRAGGVLFLCEGESDTVTLWSHGLPALGLPGSNTAGCLEEEHLAYVQKLYVCGDADDGGRAFVEAVKRKLREFRFGNEAFDLRVPGLVKDISGWHSACPDSFKLKLDMAVEAAGRIDLTRVTCEIRAPEEWGPPVPLGGFPRPAPFPTGVLPGQLQTFVTEIAEALNCPPDFVAVPLLCVAGGAVGNSRRLSVGDGESHTQSACLYGAVVGDPGSGKSPAQEKVSAPLEAAERRKLLDWKKRLKEWKEIQKRKKRGKRDDAEPDDRPQLERLLLDDTTTEKMAELLSQNERGLVMVRDELAALVLGLNQYKQGKGADRQMYLKLWAHATIRHDRKSNKDGDPILAYRPFVAIVGGIQPAVVDRLRGESHRGVPPPDDGFLDRFLVSYPDELPAVKESWRRVSEQAAADWSNTVEGLLGIKMEPGKDGPRPWILKLDAGGRRAWECFTEAHAAELNAEDFPAHLRGAWSKLRGYCGRLALVLSELHRVCDGRPGDFPVGDAAVRRAVELVNYFKSHRRKLAVAMDADPRVADARRLLRWLARNPQVEDFTRRDAYQALRGHFKRPDALDSPLRLLCDHGHLRAATPARPAGARGPNPERFEVNPLWPREDDAQVTPVTQISGYEGEPV